MSRRFEGIDYEVVRRRVRYPRLELKTGKLVVVLPLECEDEQGLIKRHERWLSSRLEEIAESRKRAEGLPLGSCSSDALRDEVRSALSEYEEELGVKVNAVFFRRMNSKWASLSKRGNLTVNTLLACLPDTYVRYAVFHELAHFFRRKHDGKFWRLVEKEFKDHAGIEGDLRAYWFKLAREGAG